LENITLDRLGRVGHLWVNKTHFGIIDDNPEVEARRDRHRARLQDAADRTTDPDVRQRYEQRLGHLLGGSVNLRVGGVTKADIDARKDAASRAAAAIRSAMHEGTVPGGGSVFLACQEMLRCRWQDASDPDERAAYAILLHAVEAPTRALCANVGQDPSYVIAQIKRQRGAFDARSGEIIALTNYTIRDAARVVQTALRTAVFVIVHHKQPAAVTDP
jgi:chaperonin GroEL